MTVKCLNELDKRDIGLFYKQGTRVKHLADMYCHSERTIRRVLEEQEIIQPIRSKQAPIPTKPSFKYLIVNYIKTLFRFNQTNA